MKKVIAVCETSGCGNEKIAILFEVPDEVEHFFCGVCSQPIANVVLASTVAYQVVTTGEVVIPLVEDTEFEDTEYDAAEE